MTFRFRVFPSGRRTRIQKRLFFTPNRRQVPGGRPGWNFFWIIHFNLFPSCSLSLKLIILGGKKGRGGVGGGGKKSKGARMNQNRRNCDFFLIIQIFNRDSDDFFFLPPCTRLCSTNSSLRSFTCRCQNAPKPSCPPPKKPTNPKPEDFPLKNRRNGQNAASDLKERAEKGTKSPKTGKKEPKRLVLGWGGAN